MSWTLKSTKVGKYYIEIYQDKYSPMYHVQVCPIENEEQSLCGYPTHASCFADFKHALRSYNYFVKKYKELVK